jgi:hypothetical protein
MTPTISALLPTRNRPLHLRSSIDSLFALAAEPGAIEVIARLDTDDPTLHESMRVLQHSLFADQIHVGIYERVGYARCNEMWNWLAEVSHGDWLLIWNDDIEMLTPGWDALLREAPQFSIQWPRRDIVATTDYTLPVIGRQVYEALGHITVNALVDAWLADVSAHADTSIARDDVVFVHHRLIDDTMNGQADALKDWHKFSEDEQRALRNWDRASVLAAPGWSSRFEGWKVEPVGIALDYLKLGPEPPRAFVLRGKI